MRKKGIALLLVLLLLLCGCSGPINDLAPSASATDAPAGEEVRSVWRNSDLVGNAPEQAPSPQEDFHGSVNHDWLTQATLPTGASVTSSFDELELQRREEINAIIQEGGSSHEAKLVQQLYDSALNMEERNRLGMEPIQPYLQQIQNIKSLEELTAFLCTEEGYLAMPFCMFYATTDDKDNTKYQLNIMPALPSLENADEYRSLSEEGARKKEINHEAYAQLLVRAGYTAEEAEKLVEASFEAESLIAANSLGRTAMMQEDYTERVYNPKTLEELAELSPHFPLSQLLEAAGLNENHLYNLAEPAWLSTLNQVYTEENLEAFKARMQINILWKSSRFLDQGCVDIYNRHRARIDGVEGETSVEKMALNICNEKLAMALGKLYTERYFSEEDKIRVEGMVDRIRQALKGRLAQADWLTEETRASAVEKLDAITVRVGFPDVWNDYTALNLEENAGLFENILRIYKYEFNQVMGKLEGPVQKGEWIANIVPQTVNGFYNPTDNSINIPAGILGGVFYDREAEDEVMLGGIGFIIAHELTHAFDTMGSQFDKEGNRVDWWSDADRAAFKERTDRVAAYFEGFEALPGINVNGTLTIGEAVADLGGIASILDVARTIEGFDYQKMFETYAKIWRRASTLEHARTRLLGDTHPPSYLRTNAIVQQFQEFYDAFNVQPEDGMYLPEEERLTVW